ncbi:MAG TPA: hypothetical protein VFR94_07380 [Nitrososphaeraceae archaeon]|nr:hypothetical protein [Nitrososphaeraceae archaeon]
MQKIKFPKTIIAAIVAVIGIASVQMISTLSIQSAVATHLNFGQCKQLQQEVFGNTKQEAHENCNLFGRLLSQGECIKFARENPEFSDIINKEVCKELFSPRSSEH